MSKQFQQLVHLSGLVQLQRLQLAIRDTFDKRAAVRVGCLFVEFFFAISLE